MRLQKAEKLQGENDERFRIATEEGRICFDLFASSVGKLLHGRQRLRELQATIYPLITLDEFQDTDASQWRVVEALSVKSTLIAVADPEQRIWKLNCVMRFSRLAHKFARMALTGMLLLLGKRLSRSTLRLPIIRAIYSRRLRRRMPLTEDQIYKRKFYEDHRKSRNA